LSPDIFLSRIAKQAPAPVYLFLGPEAWSRDRCRRALIARALGDEDREQGLTRHDLDSVSLTEVLDDARSFSLFAPRRVIWVASAEGALPRGRGAGEEATAASGLAEYLQNPVSGTVVVFDAARYEFDGEDKAKLERVAKFYGAIPGQVEFRPFTAESARRVAQDLARERGLRIGASQIGLLVEALGADAGRIATEIEKLALYAGTERPITEDDIAALVPNAQATTIFALVNALGRGDRKRSLDTLDTLLREGEYLPLALSFLATQFRLALVAHEAGLRNAQQILAWFSGQGVRMWRDRADQVAATVAAFSKPRLERAIARLFEADRALRDTRPDDRVVMEELVLSLTSGR
jgi:DNA polymerase III subunit delta